MKIVLACIRYAALWFAAANTDDSRMVITTEAKPSEYQME